jgi:hypothetical protein
MHIHRMFVCVCLHTYICLHAYMQCAEANKPTLKHNAHSWRHTYIHMLTRIHTMRRSKQAYTQAQRTLLETYFAALRTCMTIGKRRNRARQIILKWHGGKDSYLLSVAFEQYRWILRWRKQSRCAVINMMKKRDELRLLDAFCCMRSCTEELKYERQDLNESLMTVSMYVCTCACVYVVQEEILPGNCMCVC